MNRKEIIDSAEAMLSAAPSKTVILIGDFCLDVYYHINSSDLEPSLETGLMVRKVHKLRDSLGGAGNVFANLCALGAGHVIPIGVIGHDMFGTEMQNLMDSYKGSSGKLTVQNENWVTPAYMKPILDGKEQERIDTGLNNKISEESIDRMIDIIKNGILKADVVLINQQLEGSIYTDRFIDALNDIAAANTQVPFIVDARTMQNRFRGMWHKLNTHEMAAELGIELDPMNSHLQINELKDLMSRYYDLTKDPIIVSRGEFGAISYDGQGFGYADGISLLTELDTVGAGDSFLSGFALSLAAGLKQQAALNMGNGVAGVTVQKLHQTGTSSPDELRDLLSSCDFTCNADTKPVKSDSPFNCRLISPIEEIKSRPAIKYAVFDHDGTISVLREGWEEVMEACMIDAITGGQDCDSETISRIRQESRTFIRKSTGIQTINQMVMLVDIVRRHGLVREIDIKSAQEYKAIYNKALMQHISDRLEMVRCGRLCPEDVTIAGSIKLLHTLKANGVTIFLASGTDADDVRKEAELLGYDDCFDGGICGSVGDVRNDPKRVVLCKIIAESGVDPTQMVIFGDGPVEMRVAKENGALAFGLLSNEIRRYGWNESKCDRLLHAGADILVPDFTEYDKIAAFLLKK